MASVFTITAAATSLALDPSRRGQVVLSVANSSGRALRGRARVVPLNAAAAPWLSILGEAERSFAVAEVHQFTVAAAVPPDAPAGGYPFRLDLVAEDRPNEDFSQGPSIALDVPARAPRPFPWWLVAVGVAVLLLVGAVVIWLTRPPDGLPAASLTATAEANATAIAGQVATQVAATQAASAQEATRVAATQAVANVTATAEAVATQVAARRSQYNGTWRNDDPNTDGITRLVITNAGAAITVHGFGKCAPTDCDWGTRTATFSNEPFMILFQFSGGLTHRLTLFREGTKLRVVDIGSSSGTNTYYFSRVLTPVFEDPKVKIVDADPKAKANP